MTQSSYKEWYEYTTKDGDTFDALALDLYDDELLATEIIAENPDFADVLIFSAGTVLYLPVIEDLGDISGKPPWEQ